MSLEGNKILAAILLGGTLFVGANIATSDFLFGGHHGSFNPADHYPVPNAVASTGGSQQSSGPELIAPLMASADAAAGADVFGKRCASCHVKEPGAAATTGPNLWNVMGRAPGTAEFGNYSAGMQKMADKPWLYEELSQFIYKPKSYVSGTSMGFAGLRKDSERADLIAYLRTLSDAPVALPTSAPAAVEAVAAEQETAVSE